MSSSLTVKDEKFETGGGGRPPIEPRDYGDGGGGRGDGAPDFGERLRRCRLGMALGLVAVVIMFLCFTGAYLARAGFGGWDPAAGRHMRDWQPLTLPLALLTFNTIVLVVSSITLELARRQEAARSLLAQLANIPGIDVGRPIPWLAVSTVLGGLFLAGQMLAWHDLSAHGFDAYAGASSSFFYILTGAHALHLLGGLIALLYAAAATTWLARPPETRRIAVDVTAWYWHVMALLWVYIFILLVIAS